jgi:transposase
MEDILDVYQRPYDESQPVVCMDETNKQQLKEVREEIPMEAGKPVRFDTEYERNGTSNIFISFEPLKGKRRLKVTDERKRSDWAHFIREIVDEDYPHAEKIILVMDNLNTHSGASLYETFEPAEARRILNKLEIHYTPKHGSWLNMAELELSHLSRQCLNRRIESQEKLRKEIAAWERSRNQKQVKVNWQFTTECARIKLKKLYPIIEEINSQN